MSGTSVERAEKGVRPRGYLGRVSSALSSRRYLKSLGIRAPYSVLAHPDSVSIDAGNDVRIMAGCTLIGNITLGDNVVIREDTILEGDINIGARSRIAYGNEIVGRVGIGKYCAIAREVTFKDRNHFMHFPTLQARLFRDAFDEKMRRTSKGPITVGHDVWVGKRGILLSGINVGHGAVVGAGSVVTKDVEPYSVVAGAPAEHRSYRFPEDVRRQLLDIEWWNWDMARIRRNRRFFKTDLSTVEDVRELIVDR